MRLRVSDHLPQVCASAHSTSYYLHRRIQPRVGPPADRQPTLGRHPGLLHTAHSLSGTTSEGYFAQLVATADATGASAPSANGGCAADMVEASELFRQVNGHMHLPTPRAALERQIQATTSRGSAITRTSHRAGHHPKFYRARDILPSTRLWTVLYAREATPSWTGH